MEKDRVFQMRVSPDFLALIDEWRRRQPEIPPRARAIRELAGRGIAYEQAVGLLKEARSLRTRRRLFDDDENALNDFLRRVDEHLARLGDLTVSDDPESP